MIDRGFVFLIFFTISFFAFSQSNLGSEKGALRTQKTLTSEQRLNSKQLNEDCPKEADLKNDGLKKDDKTQGSPCRTLSSNPPAGGNLPR